MLDELTQSKPDLIILDLILPEMDGLEIMKEARKV
jgi:CheY-like chemotaxis protein